MEEWEVDLREATWNVACGAHWYEFHECMHAYVQILPLGEGGDRHEVCL